MIDKIWEMLTTFSKEAQQAALDKCLELNYDPNQGVVSLNESFINLSSARLTLVDAIEKKKLIQLPISIQKILLGHLEAISKSLVNLIGGIDEVVNLTQAIENLNTAIWQYGLHNLSEEVLGYQEKLNQLKQLDLEARNLNTELRKGRKLKSILEDLIKEFQNSDDSIKANLSKSTEETKSISDNLTSTTKTSQDAAALLAVIQQSDETVAKYLSDSNTRNAEIKAVETKIKEFYGEINQYKSDISETRETAEKAVKANTDEIANLIGELQNLEGQIKLQIEKATGYSLFHSFQTRQESLNKSTKFWWRALAVCVFASICLTLYISKTTTNFDVAFYLKLSMAIPLFYAITFCTVQYSRERKLEEEYAFKSNISISLMPYQQLVEKLVDSGDAIEKAKYTAFIIDSVTKVFTSPTDKIFEGETKESEKGLVEKFTKQITEFLETVIKEKH